MASSWRGRWDSFTLVTPNWTLEFPGSPYNGDDPEGHVARDEIVAYLERYAARHAGDPQRRSGRPDRTRIDDRIRIETSDGPLDADEVVVCTGAFQCRIVRRVARTFPAGLTVIDATGYRRPDSFPDGKILVVGSGQTGVQLAEELTLAGRDRLACGRAPWVPRRIGDLDGVTWMAARRTWNSRCRTSRPGSHAWSPTSRPPAPEVGTTCTTASSRTSGSP